MLRRREHVENALNLLKQTDCELVQWAARYDVRLVQPYIKDEAGRHLERLVAIQYEYGVPVIKWPPWHTDVWEAQERAVSKVLHRFAPEQCLHFDPSRGGGEEGSMLVANVQPVQPSERCVPEGLEGTEHHLCGPQRCSERVAFYLPPVFAFPFIDGER